MTLEKCKTCGGELERIDNCYVCNYCGNKWIIDADNDVHVIDRANAWSALRDGDFERAAELFENIILKEQDSHEAYWGRALANAGIVYVFDFNENKKIPTCNNISDSSFKNNRDVKKAIQLAPADIADTYKAQAQQIENIRSEWAKKASKEPPYDIFICYKDSDRENDIDRTDDSYDAHELYNQLTAEGYKVFFSRVSLKTKVSEHYEPYIYNAIKTAKVMIVFGEKPEYFNSVWVKNEWMRFRKCIESGEKNSNSLVVAYKNISPNDLPIGLRSRQCLDASRMDFLDNLKKHIASVIKAEKTIKSEKKSTERKEKISKETKEIKEIKEPKEKVIKETEEKISFKESEKREKKKRSRSYLIVLVVIIILLGILPYVPYGLAEIGNIKIPKKAQKVANNIEIAITNKTNSDSSKSNVEFILDFTFKNNSDVDVNYIAGNLKIMNADGDALFSTKAWFGTELDTTPNGYRIPKNFESNFTLTVEEKITDSIIELWETDFASLNISFEITNIRVENDKIAEVTCEPYVKQNTTNFKEIYQNALTLFNQGKYDEAEPLFEKLGEYKDSYDYYEQCCSHIETATQDAKYNEAMAFYAQEKYGEAIKILNEIYDYKDSVEKIEEIKLAVELKAETIAATGNYIGACKMLEQLGDDASDSNIYKAYVYANEGNFVEAVKCGLTVAVIPEGVESIPDNYFKNQTYALKKVVLPSTIKSIGSSAFYGCSKLEEINLPAGIVTINPYAFSSCSSLSAIQLPEGLIAIGDNAFSYCSNLKQIQWSSTIVTIGNNAFRGCDSITNLSLPSNITSIGNGAFAECDGLLTVSIPGSIKTISDEAFNYCTRLTQVTINSGTEVIGAYAFNKCSMLSNVTLPDTLKEIKNNAFYQCVTLVEITIPAQVTYISKYAFCICSSLQRVYFENTEGWVQDSARNLNVTDAQANARALKLDSAGSWRRS